MRASLLGFALLLAACSQTGGMVDPDGGYDCLHPPTCMGPGGCAGHLDCGAFDAALIVCRCDSDAGGTDAGGTDAGAMDSSLPDLPSVDLGSSDAMQLPDGASCTPGGTSCGPGLSCCSPGGALAEICMPTCTDPSCIMGCHPVR